MFIWNHSKTALLNVDYIVSISISAPRLEQKDYQVVANLTCGNSVLFKGTESECKATLINLRDWELDK